MKNFRAYELAKELYLEVEKLNLKGELRDQIHRASLSIVLNLAEGSGKRTSKDRKRFYSISYGSIREVQAILDITFRDPSLIELADGLAAHTYRLIKNPGSGA